MIDSTLDLNYGCFQENWGALPAQAWSQHNRRRCVVLSAPWRAAFGDRTLETAAPLPALCVSLFARKADCVAIIMLATAQRAWNFNNCPVQ